MVSASQDYMELKASISEFKAILRRVPHTSNDTKPHHLKVQSFILLSHAAFEEFIETIANKLLDESVLKFYATKKVNPCIASLIVFETISQFDENSTRATIKRKVVENLNDFVAVARKNHKNDIAGNHGVKLKDQKKVLLSVGLDPIEIDSVTASALDAFGTKRGKFAHTAKITTTETRSSATSEVDTILLGLKNFDEAVVVALKDL
ncbi:HEPN domain-containing protein [Pseudophaeobacter sp.]|uniref:HEPN domain-containing protein n=1 Tax=Pseudophaeobacter sp. TaxID=1971739 RepID=UPI00260AF1D2|nr:HEPN domain-containing protein [Pseudophaeobacter sp.]